MGLGVRVVAAMHQVDLVGLEGLGETDEHGDETNVSSDMAKRNLIGTTLPLNHTNTIVAVTVKQHCWASPSRNVLRGWLPVEVHQCAVV